MASDNATVVQILDRLYAINQLIPGINKALRYFPEDPKTAWFPVITAIPGRATHTPAGESLVQSARVFLLLLWAESFTRGIMTQSAQAAAEPLIDAVLDTYWARPRLELILEGRLVPLDGVIDATSIDEDTAIISDPRALATITFSLTVTTEHTVNRLGQELD